MIVDMKLIITILENYDFFAVINALRAMDFSCSKIDSTRLGAYVRERLR